MTSHGIGARGPPADDGGGAFRNQQTDELSKGRQMKVLYINNDGGGFADYTEVEEQTTVEEFFGQKLPGSSAGDYLIRVNRQPVPADYVLQDGDRVTITSTKIEGAIGA